MTTRYANAEGGANGATVNVADTGSGTVWDTGTLGTGATFTYSSTGGCRRGGAGLCYAYAVGGTSALSRRGWNINSGAATGAAPFRCYIDPADFSGATVIIARGMDSAGNTQRWRLILTSSAVSLRDSANAGVTGSTSGALSSGTRYRIEGSVAGSTTGASRLIVYVGESTTALFDSGAQTGNFGGVIQSAHLGIAASSTSQSGKVDDFMVGEPGDPLFGPAVVNSGGAALSGSGTLTGAGRGVIRGAAVLTGSGTLAGAGRVSVAGAAALTGSGALAGTGRVVVRGAATLAAVGTAALAGRASVYGAAALAGSGALIGAGRVVVRGGASFLADGSASMAGDAVSTVATVTGAAVWSAAGSASMAGVVVVRGAAMFTAESAATLTPTLVRKTARRSSTPSTRGSSQATQRRAAASTDRGGG